MPEYKELTEEEFKIAQDVDRQIDEWASVDFKADMEIYSILRVFNRELAYRGAVLQLEADLGLTREKAQELLKKSKTNPIGVLEYLVKKYEDSPLSTPNSEAYKRSYNRTLAEYQKHKAIGEDAQQKVYALNKQYTGWRRFWVVPGGHIHDNYGCSTCHKMGKATEMRWLWQLSGLELEDAVEKYGHIICSVCYPEAPTEWSSMVEGQAERESDRCPGSRQPAIDGKYDYRRRSNYGTCGTCKGKFIINDMLLIRAHKKYVDPNCSGSLNEPTSLVGDGETYGICSGCGKRRQLKWGDKSVIDTHKRPKE